MSARLRPSKRWRSIGFIQIIVAAAFCGILGMGSPVWADLIVLRGGGQIQGKVIPDPKNKDRVQVLLMQGRHPLLFRKVQITRIDPVPSPLDDYVIKRAKVADTADAQYTLGYWCERNDLKDLARLHYKQALAFDPDHDGAHEKLGHKKVDGVWLTRDDLSTAQGLVKYKGRWITREEKNKREDEEKISATQASWLRRLRVLRKALIGGSPDRQREAESQLMAIQDPDAVVPLLKTFGRDKRPRRILLALVLSAMEGPEATMGLVQRILDEPDPEVRSVTFEHLRQRHEPKIVGRFVRALGHKDLRVINRAAWALGNLNAVDAVPHLVGALVTYEQRIVLPPEFGGPAPPPGAMPASPGLTPRTYNNFGVVVATRPRVAPNAVAYGIGVVPWYAGGGNYLPGGNAVLTPKPQRDAHVETFNYRNVEVLNALQKLTGQDFGYDAVAWRHWMTRSFNPHPAPARSVPQP